MSMEKYYIPKHLDAPARILFWTFDEALMFMVPMFIGVMTNHGVIGILFAVGLFKGWKRIKGVGNSNLLKCLAYWHYPASVLGLKSTPDSSIRNYLG